MNSLPSTQPGKGDCNTSVNTRKMCWCLCQSAKRGGNSHSLWIYEPTHWHPLARWCLCFPLLVQTIRSLPLLEKFACPPSRRRWSFLQSVQTQQPSLYLSWANSKQQVGPEPSWSFFLPKWSWGIPTAAPATKLPLGLGSWVNSWEASFGHHDLGTPLAIFLSKLIGSVLSRHTLPRWSLYRDIPFLTRCFSHSCHTGSVLTTALADRG